MKYPRFFFRKMLPVALALGTAWAARGQIGHEYGAAWAAAIGVFALIALSGRKDWWARLPTIAALAAIAWGAGGLISYGQVVGYGYSGDYLNVSYGLLMLLFIGALFGFLGGGITGLALESAPAKKIDWAALLTQLFAGGFLGWGLFIYELEWLMTPPRSEMWAACLGACAALGWYLYRNGYRHALRTAFFTALGAGFGFGAGNFFQRMGAASGIAFNWWNVMEYSIGFFGGLGLAYGVFSDDRWPEGREANQASNTAGWIFLIVLLPAVCLIEGLKTKSLMATGTRLPVDNPASFAFHWQGISWILSVIFMILMGWIVYRYNRRSSPAGIHSESISGTMVRTLTIFYLAWYILISNIIGATWLTARFSSQHLYWVNLLVLYFLLSAKPAGAYGKLPDAQGKTYQAMLLKCWLLAIFAMLLLSYIAISCSPARPNPQFRFIY